MKYLIKCPDEVSHNSSTEYFLENKEINWNYTNYIAKAIHDEIPKWVLGNENFRDKIINSDSTLFKTIVKKEIIRLKELVQNGVFEVNEDIKKLEKVLKKNESHR